MVKDTNALMELLSSEYLHPLLTQEKVLDAEVFNAIGEGDSCDAQGLLLASKELGEAALRAKHMFWVSVALLRYRFGMPERAICTLLGDQRVHRTTLRSKLRDERVLSTVDTLIRVSEARGKLAGSPLLEPTDITSIQ
jgi:hypothetical protein